MGVVLHYLGLGKLAIDACLSLKIDFTGLKLSYYWTTKVSKIFKFWVKENSPQRKAQKILWVWNPNIEGLQITKI